MDLNTVIARAKAILLTPKTEWPAIAERTETVQGIYKDYLFVIAAIPAVFGFLQESVLGFHVPVLGTYRVGIVSGLIGMVVRYAVSLGAIYLLALIVDALAPNFGGQKNRLQAFKTVAYASTAGAVASAAVIVPGIGQLLVLVGSVYTLYLLYLGLPVMMKAPQQKAVGYTAVVVVSTIVIFLALGWVIGSFARPGVSGLNSATDSGHFDKGSLLGKAEELGNKMEAANKKMEEAQKSGDTKAQQEAMGQMMGGLFSGGDVVEALPPEKIKGFLPESLGGFTRKDASAERNQAMGMQMSNARATYSDGTQHSLDLEITDMGSAKGFAAAASWAAVEQDKQTDTGYEKTYKADGRMVHEQWDNGTKDGEYSVILADRFAVKVTGRADSIDALKSAAGLVDLSGLEALKNEGVKTGG